MSGNHYGPLRSLPLVAALVASLLLATPLHASTYTFRSANWGGYVVQLGGTGSSAQTGVANYVSGSWTVPTATASPAPSASSSSCQCGVWVGLDGFLGDTGTIEQLGTASDYNNGSTNYYAWYEMYPSGPVTEFSVQPGDSITASVQYSPSGGAGAFLLSLTDNTRNQSFSLSKTNASAQRSSAEWIVEAPNSVFNGIVPLPGIGSVTFTGATATLGTESGPIDNPDWATTSVLLVASSHTSPPYVNSTLLGPVEDTGSDGSATSSFTVTQTPEPSSMALTAATAAITGGIAAARRRRRRRAKR